MTRSGSAGSGGSVESVAVEPFDLGLSTPLSTARGEIESRAGVVVRVVVDGVRGVGEATPLAGWSESLDDCRAALAAARDRVDERDGVDVGALLAAVDDAPAARHGLALATADAACRAVDRPLAAALVDGDVATVPGGGGTPTAPAARVPVNATVGDDDPGVTVAAVRDAVDAGYPTVKLKVGVRDLEADVERVEAVRAAVGDRVAVRVDANGAWDRSTARRAVEAFATLGIDYVEQPLPAEDVAGHADLRGRGVAIAVDESLGAVDPVDVLDADAADVLVCKPMALGGVDRVRALAAGARARAAEGTGPAPDVVVTTTVDAAVARAGAVHLAASLPGGRACGLATADMLADDLLADPAPVTEGGVAVPEGAGLGTAFDDLRDGR